MVHVLVAGFPCACSAARPYVILTTTHCNKESYHLQRVENIKMHWHFDKTFEMKVEILLYEKETN